jgi:hypothetical protein
LFVPFGCLGQELAVRVEILDDVEKLQNPIVVPCLDNKNLEIIWTP